MNRRERMAARRRTGRTVAPIGAIAPQTSTPIHDDRLFDRTGTPLRTRNVDPIVRPFDRVRDHPVRQTVRLWGGRRVDQGEVWAA